MDNNPFRSTQPAQPNVSNNGYMANGYQPQPQQQQQPQQLYGGNNNTSGYSTPTNTIYPQSQPQQAWQSSTSIGPSTPYSPLAATQQLSPTPYSTYNQQSFTPPYQAQPQQQQQQQYSPYTNTGTSLMSSTPNPIGGSLGGGNTYQPYQATTMPTPNNYQQPMYGNMGTNNGMQQPQYNGLNNSNFYIPPDFGQSTTTPNTNYNNNNNNNMFQPQQPRHAPVDASTLLKGTQVRRVECPVCQKMIEGDDMAVNHHVNEHYS